MQRVALRTQHATFERRRPDVRDVQVKCRVRYTSGKARLYRTPSGRIENARDDAAVHTADNVVMLSARAH